MLKKVENLLTYWLPPVLWMVLIFYLSTFERALISEKRILNFLFFKTLHVLEYGLLYFLIFRAFFTLKVAKKKLYIVSFVISLVYAISDELHQTFVPTREGKLRDIFIDLGGISIMYIYIRNNIEFLRKKLL